MSANNTFLAVPPTFPMSSTLPFAVSALEIRFRMLRFE